LVKRNRARDFETELVELLRLGQLTLGPFRLRLERALLSSADGILRAELPGSKFERRFVFEGRVSWPRRARAEAVAQLREEHGPKLLPMLVAPYLSERVLDELVEEKVSALDLCGNGLLIDLPRLFVLRTGARKQKSFVRPVRLSIYDSGNVANLVPRVVLSQSSFPTTKAVLETCHARMMPSGAGSLPLTLPTVSKALRVLDDDLVTDRRGRERILRDPARLLELLQRGARLPSGSTSTFKTKFKPDEIWAKLRPLRPDVRFVTTGRGSAQRYTGLAGPARLQLYVSDVQSVAQLLQAKPTQAFPNLELTHVDEEAPYFDARECNGVVWSSPLQCYLELARVDADPRERDAAEDLRAKLVRVDRFNTGPAT
jgi:hypothetical protein